MQTARILKIFAPLFVATALPAFQPDYFPLHVGNQWVYRQTGIGAGEPVVVEIARTDTFGGRHYALLRGLPTGDAWLRGSEEGTLFAWDRDRNLEVVWAAFATPEGGTYATEIDPCSRTARVESRNASFQVPVGSFDNGLRIVYPPSGCADAGLASDIYLPWIGLLKREMITIAGPRTLELIYAHIGGVTVLTEPHVAFSLTVDRNVFEAASPAPVMMARLTIRNTRPEPLELLFPTGQRFDLVLRNESGAVVYRWSDGRFFTQVLGVERIGPGERNYLIRAPLAGSRGEPLPAGRYVAEGWLTTMGPKAYSATVGLEIRASR